MTPAARISAAIEVIADIEARRRPAVDVLKDWGLAHRFAGSSDRAAAYPQTKPITPTDLAATVYHALGIDPNLELRNHLGQLQYLAPGEPLTALFALSVTPSAAYRSGMAAAKLAFSSMAGSIARR